MLTMQDNNKQQICPDIFAGKRVLVIGLGKTGMSCVRFLYARGVELAVTDSRIKPPALQELKDSYPDVAVFLGGFDSQAIASSDILLVSPGVPVGNEMIAQAKEQGKEIIGDIEIFSRCNTTPVVAITGSNGKSTVTTLVGEMARLSKRKVQIGGNIGVPVLELLDTVTDTELYVLELSSFQLETTYNLNAAACVILNISEDHMDRYSSLDAYAAAKANIFQGSGAVIINRDDPCVVSLASTVSARRRIYAFTLNEPDDENTFGLVAQDGELWLAKGKQLLLPVSRIKIKGRHNVANALAALALGDAMQLPMPAMLEALQTFPGLPHRTQWVTEHEGVNWFNDSKATNVGAAIAAIDGLPAEKLVVLMGGQGKGQDFAPLKNILAPRARHVLLYGEDAGLIEQALGSAVPNSRVANLAEAVIRARQLAQPGDAVLLSPACASFDMFDGYEHRGNIYMQLVKEVTG